MLDEKFASQTAAIKMCKRIEELIESLDTLSDMIVKQTEDDREAWLRSGGFDSDFLLAGYADFARKICFDEDQITSALAQTFDEYIKESAGSTTEIGKQAAKVRDQLIALNPANSPEQFDGDSQNLIAKNIFNYMQYYMCDRCDYDTKLYAEASEKRYELEFQIYYDSMIYPVRMSLEYALAIIAQKYFFAHEDKKLTDIMQDILSKN